MNELHERLIDNINFKPKEGQGNNDNLSCSNERKLVIPCPSLDVKELSPKKVEYLESFFRNIIKIEVEKYIKENSIKKYE